ncbi:MAG: YciI family protein [Candidatus Limnocylindrales bacterium]
MRFFMYTLGDENDPRLAEPPTPEMMATMGAFMAEAKQAGTLIETGGFAPSSMGAKVALSGETYTVTDGPFSEAKELIGGWALVELASLDEAIVSAKRFLGIVGGGESRIRRVFGPEDGPPR